MYVSSVALAALCHSEMRIYTGYNNRPAAQPCWRYLWRGTLCRLFFAQHVVYLPSDLCGICNSIRKTARRLFPPKLVDNRPHWACNFPKKPTPVCSATTRISNRKERKRKLRKMDGVFQHLHLYCLLVRSYFFQPPKKFSPIAASICRSDRNDHWNHFFYADERISHVSRTGLCTCTTCEWFADSNQSI